MIDETVETEEKNEAPRGTRRGALRFDRLRLDGFKSFADPAVIDIEPGLTGIVGPNGCGKSNLLEALRWNLGETSAKRMRGEGMDDVIFGGTERRQARNVSEVGVLLDNRSRTAPPEINDSDSIEIVRRIERGQGTSYRVNGRPMRLRDVQILFQDNASGAGSSSIVSQGRVVALINAKASERRGVLEEAAGVSGLSARRHDFELKLRQTEQNLQRAEDSLSEVNNQVTQLRRQARALQRWREFDQRIRTTTAIMLLARWRIGQKSLLESEAAHKENEERIAEAMIASNEAARRREAAAAALPALREARTNADMELARANARLEGIDNEAERFAKELFELQQRSLELSADRAREDMSIAEADRTIRGKREEQAEIAEMRAGEAERMEVQSDALDTARDKVAEADAKVTELSTAIASADTARAAARRQREESERRLQAVEARLKEAETRLATATQALPDASRAEALSEVVETTASRAEMLETQANEAEQSVERLRIELDERSSATSRLSGDIARLEAELEGLASIREEQGSASPVSARLRIEAGYEAAVAAVLGDALGAGTDRSESVWWRAGARSPAAIPGSRTLADVVSGVPELVAALSAAIIVEPGALEGSFPLPVGMIAVARDGSFLRWDGHGGRRAAGSVEASLLRRARILALSAQIDELRPQLDASRATASTMTTALADARRREGELKVESRSTADRLRQAREELSRLAAAGEEARRAVAVAEEQLRATRAERQVALQDFGAAGAALAAIPEDADATAQLQKARTALLQARETESSAKVAMERLTNEQSMRRQKADALMRDLLEWGRRLQQAQERRVDLSRRYEDIEKQTAEMETRKATPGEAREEAKVAAETAADVAKRAAAAADAGETERNAAEESARRIEAALANYREERGRILGVLAQAQTIIATVESAVVERLAATPADLPAIAGHQEGTPLPDPDITEAQLHRLETERQNFGAVNFLAEQELEEHDKRLGEMEKGRQEIKEALVKLRQGIAEIEEEARTKLEDAFTTIDASFGKLFQTLFGGGQAHLKLVGEDILEAGLEIYASPPGKRLQVLSLLSGGEQTLTAMALIFAAFLSNPSPICVLDEADAALDDSNTDRLIRLVETMAANDATRFLVVTHNPLTMARMDRLFGVTMAERGISTVSKVDLGRAMEFIEE